MYTMPDQYVIMFFYFYFIVKFHAIVATRLLQIDFVCVPELFRFFVCLFLLLLFFFLLFLTSEVSSDRHKAVEVVRWPPPIFSIFSPRKILTAILLKNWLGYRCFPVNFVKFLATPFCIEHLQAIVSELYCFLCIPLLFFHILKVFEHQHIESTSFCWI